MIILSYAKINLGLLILGKRTDGFHDIATLFQEISLGDTIRLRRQAAGISITCSRPDIPVDERNIIWQAFERFRKRTGVDDGLAVDLEKRIPSGAGLGGGSSNAAAVLAAANRLWDTGLTEADLCEIGAGIGSDVPFFIKGGTQFGRGRGEILEPVPMRHRYYILLVCPGIHVSTSRAYGSARIALTKEEKFTTFRALFPGFDEVGLRKHCVNDFETTVFGWFPLLADIKERLYGSGSFYASMSGSGSTMFGLYRRRDDAEKAMAHIRAGHDLTCHICTPVYER
ncbi:4-(cytidine 5'-diphospho)-2-C-methyl-D-erythritol kinase [bacterium]|nr:4-(cytidine 5'-diphospho)-2-C-methyl-D-erythritol kinase [bacterium]